MTYESAAERLERLRIADIMVPLDSYPQVTPQATLRDAIHVMVNAELVVAGRKSLPRVLLVSSAEGVLDGLVRRRDVLRGLEPKFLTSKPLDYRKKLFDVEFDSALSELSLAHVIRGMEDRADRRVTEIMRPLKGRLDHRDTIVTAVYEMNSLGVPLLPVERDGRIVGIVRTVEVFSELVGLIG